MRDGQKVFNCGTGVIILSNDDGIVLELKNNNNFIEFTPPFGRYKLHIFASSDIAPELHKTGLPHNVLKFLVNSQ